MTFVIGLTVANASSHPGIVAGGAKAELANVGGRSKFGDGLQLALVQNRKLTTITIAGPRLC